MHIGIIGAMQQEVVLLQQQLLKPQTQQIGTLNFIQGYIQGHQITLVQCGVGKVAAALAASVLIQVFAPDAVINMGAAGGLRQSQNVGDLVIAEAVQHHDVDMTAFGFALGQVFEMPLHYSCAAHLINAAKHSADRLQMPYQAGIVGSGDSFINADEITAEIKQQFPDLLAVEMEGAAVGQVCYCLNTPFLVLRSLSDIAGKTSYMSFDTFLTTAAERATRLLLAMLEQL